MFTTIDDALSRWGGRVASARVRTQRMTPRYGRALRLTGGGGHHTDSRRRHYWHDLTSPALADLSLHVCVQPLCCGDAEIPCRDGEVQLCSSPMTRQLGRLGPVAATCLASVPEHTCTRPTISVCPRRPSPSTRF